MSNISEMRQFYFQCFENSQGQQQQLQPQQQIQQLQETIDLSSPPSSPVSPAAQENPLRPNIAGELTRMPEQMWSYDTSNNAAYKVNDI